MNDARREAIRAWGLWGVAFVTGSAALAVGTAAAAEKQAVGVMNQQLVIEKSKTGQRALEELKAYSAARQQIIASDEEELKDLEKSAQDPKLKDEQRREKENAFRLKFEAYQRRIQDFNREIQTKQKEMVDEYAKRIGAAALAVAQRRGYAAVLDEGAEGNLRIVIYHHRSVDMTDEVIKEFDSRAASQ